MRRFSRDEFEIITAYLWHNWTLPASGERAVTVLLAPGAWPRLPLRQWLRVAGSVPCSIDEGENHVEVPVHILGPGLRKGCPVSIVYGEEGQDWMNKKAGDALAEALTQQGCPCTTHRVDGAGHLVNIDEPYAFADLVLKLCA